MEDGMAEVSKQVERLTREAVGAPVKEPRFVKGPDERAYMVVRPDGTVEERFYPGPPRGHQARSVAALAGLARHVMTPPVVDLQGVSGTVTMPGAVPIPGAVPGAGADDPAALPGSGGRIVERGELADVIPGAAEAFVAVKAGCPSAGSLGDGHERLPLSRRLEAASAQLVVCCVFDAAFDGPRRQRAWLRLERLRTLAALKYLETVRPRLTQEEVIYLLRDELNMRGSVLLTQVRSVRVGKNDAGQRTITPTKDTLGGSTDAEVLSDHGEFPDTFVVEFDAVAGLDTDSVVEVECTFTVHPRDATFQITPVPGAIEEAMREAEQELCDDLAAMANDGMERPVLVAFAGEEGK